jgi:ribonuclease P protein component
VSAGGRPPDPRVRAVDGPTLTCDLPGVPSEQAYVPAEQPPAGENARLPAAHAHPGWPRHPGVTAPEGARARQRLTARDSGSAMLPAAARMRRKADFASAMRGSRVGRPLVSGHLLVRPDSDEPALVGFAVGRAVGTAVVRNKVRRRLRHLCRGYLDRLPGGSLLVLRASPRAAAARQADLAADLDLVIGKLLGRQGWVAGR